MKGFKKFLLVAVIALIAATSFTACSACGEKTTKYELSFATNGGDAIASVSVEEGASYTLPTPVREGYEFDGWYLNADFTGERVTEVTVTAESTVYAKWTRLGTVTLDTDGGTLDVTTVTLKTGENIYEAVKDLAPEKAGLTFGAWFLGGEELSSSAVMPEEDITLTAKYLVGYTVEIYLQNADATGYDKSENVTGSGYVGAEYVPEVEMKGFTETDNENAVTEGVLSENAADNLFRHYFDRNRITLTFDPSYPDGREAEIVVLEDILYGTAAEIPSDFSMQGYVLTGWAVTEGGEAEYASSYIFDRLHNKQEGETAPGGASDFTQSATLYGVWTRGYRDMFGGGDYIYIVGDEIYIDRSGIFFRGEYDAEDGTFIFIGEDNRTRVSGKINDDRTFVYEDRERANMSATLFLAGTGLDRTTTIYFDEYNGLTYRVTQEGASDKISNGTYTIEDNVYTVIFEEGDFAGQMFSFVLGSVTDGNNTVQAFQKRDEEELGMGIIGRALIDTDGSLVSLIDEYYSITLNGLGVATYRVDTQTANYYYTYDKETMILTLRNSNMQTAGVMKVSVSNGRYIWMPYEQSQDLDITVGTKTLSLDGAYQATYNDGTNTVTGNYVMTESVFGNLATVYAGDVVYKFLITSTTTEVTTGEGEDQKTETVITYSFEQKPTGYVEYYYSAADAIYKLPLLVMDDTAANRISLYGYTASGSYVKLSSGRYVKNQSQYTYYAEEFFAPDNLSIEQSYDEDGNFVSYIYYEVNPDTEEKTVWMRPQFDIINVETAIFSVDSENTSYNVSYWHSYTPSDGETVICTERYTSESGESLTRIGGFAQYVSGGEVIVGSFAPEDNYYVLVSGENTYYFELDEEARLFSALEYAPVTASKLLSDGSADANTTLALDGKGGAVYSITTKAEQEGEEDVTVTYTGTVTDSGSKTAFGVNIMRFREEGRDGLTFDFILISTGKNYFSIMDETYMGELNADGMTLVLDGFFYQASYTDVDGNTVEGIYYINEDGGVCLYTDNGYLYFDLTEEAFTKRGDEYGSYLVLNNQTNGGMAVTFDGYGKLEIRVTALNDEGEYETNVVASDVDYVIDGDICTFTYTTQYGEVTLTGKLGVYIVDSSAYRAFYALNEETVTTLVNTSDWSVLSLDGYGNAVKYAQNGATENGTYMLITDDMLYYVNSAATDASIYIYDLQSGTIEPAKFTAFGYYTRDLESLMFTRYGFAIFNGVTRYYYNVVDGVCYLYHQEFDEQGLIPQETNKYGFIEEVFGEFTDTKEYDGKTYYRDEGVALSFTRDEATADDYKIPLSNGDEIQYVTIGNVTFTPSGSEEFAVIGNVQLGENYYNAYFYREINGDDVEMYILIPLTVGYYRLDISVDYTGGGKLNTYEVTAMKRIISLPSYQYLYVYYYIAMYFGQSFADSIPNTYGSVELVYEYDTEGQETVSYMTGAFGEDSGFYDINGNIVTFDRAEFKTEGNGFVAEIKVKNAEDAPADEYTYRMHFGAQYVQALGTYGYVVLGFTRVQTFETADGYTVEVERLIDSDTQNDPGYVYNLMLTKDGEPLEYEMRLLSGGNWHIIVRTTDENDKITSTKYYKVVLTEMVIEPGEPGEDGEEPVTVVAPYESAVVTEMNIETVYAANGEDYIDISEDNSIMLMVVGDTVYAVSESLYDGENGTYTVSTGSGDKFTVTVSETEEGKTAVITEVEEEQPDAEQ